MIARCAIAAFALLLATGSSAQTLQPPAAGGAGAPATAPPEVPIDWCETAGLAPADERDCAVRMERAATNLEREEIRAAFRARLRRSPSSVASPPK